MQAFQSLFQDNYTLTSPNEEDEAVDPKRAHVRTFLRCLFLHGANNMVKGFCTDDGRGAEVTDFSARRQNHRCLRHNHVGDLVPGAMSSMVCHPR